MRHAAHRRPLSGISAAIALTFALLTVPAAAVQTQDAARGAALMALARQAIGGAKGLDSVKTLQVTGTFRRVVGGADTEGDFDVFVELPDRYLRSEKTGIPGQPSTETIEALVGATVRDATRGGRAGAGGDGGRGGAPDSAGSSAVEPADDTAQSPPERGSGDTPSTEAAAGPAATGRGGGGLPADPDVQRRARQAEVSRLLLMWLLRSEAPLAWVGTAQSPDGTADVLEVRYADGQPTRLFLESKTHMPLMLQWTAAPARGAGASGRRGGGGRRGAAPDGAGPSQGEPTQLATLDMRFSEHRVVNGIRLPYVITRGASGQATEQWTISRYRVNPSLDPATFTR